MRYKEGFSDYQRVLNAQQALFTQQQRYIGALGENVRNLVALYKSLGAGWEESTEPLIDDDTRQLMETRTDWGDVLDQAE